MSAIFVTATGTDVGKTFITTGLIRHIRAAGRPVDAIKPVVSGFDPAAWQEGDPAALVAALGRPISFDVIERISPWRFKAPLSPDVASRREGRTINFQELTEFCRRAMAARKGVLLIEGIGGVMVPLDEHRTVLDLMSVLRIPVILVAGSYVGTISHSLTALEVLARRNIDIAAIVVSESVGSAAPLDETVAAIARFADAIDVVGIARMPANASDHPAFGRLAALL
jgi:dethiobiotin synthetase